MALSAQTPRQQPPATMEDFLAIPAADRWHEFVDGQIIQRAVPVCEHGYAQRKIGAFLDDYDGPEGKNRPGGWWIVIDSEVDFPQFRRRLRPDLTGWRCDRMPNPPKGIPALRPDWVCEIISPEKRRYDVVEKRLYYAEAAIPFYWLLDYERASLTALQLEGDRYIELGEAGLQDAPRFAPFDRIEIPIDRLFPR
ncbi:Uma2 family endonuclease [Haliangium sp. UPWRP_2]|uniref:Uma2 family endonuclease n=1 Tax=Haliangium sp. UPWRP_2 TaxID=1931276 RepID=UPI000B53D543|nr:Uma2 family endonuclease [Haliangium sp. UPWRP_2]PSM32347.1 Uma2 family endonuclease [Haliangium sp. UPWRP_2]HNN95043.1 Uma2 family endonuclease [Pseudomonadota bacterium]